MAVIYTGPTGSGKTSILLDKYNEISRQNRTDDCLVFLKNRASIAEWTSKLELEIIGAMNIYTYFSFVQKEIKNYWTYLESSFPGGAKNIEPTFMNVETSHYIMSKYVDKHRVRKDIFEYLNAGTSQIAVQLIDNLNQAAMNLLSFEDLKERLLSWAGSEQEKRLVFNEAISIMKVFRKFCMENRILDYSLIIDLFNKHLLNRPEYISELGSKYSHIFIDNLEKTVPSAQQFYLNLLKKEDNVFMAFNPEERINRFFGGNADLAKKSFFSKAKIINLDSSYTSSDEARDLAKSLYGAIFKGQAIKKTKFIKGEIESEFRGDMLIKTAEKVVELIEAGTDPDEIALIAPNIDKVMEFTYERYFTKKGYNFFNMSRSKRLVDLPYSQALITLTLLTNLDWREQITYSSLQQTLSLVLKLDPIRAALLADEIFKNNFVLAELDDIDLRSRIGFDFSERYNYLRNWIEGKKDQTIDLEYFFQLVFAELLAPLEPDYQDILSCRQMIDSISNFQKVVKNFKDFKEKEMGKHFIDMIFKGTLAAEFLYNIPEDLQKIVLTTPYKFLFNPEIKSVKYLFWMDISSKNWLRSIAKELTNPYLLAPQRKDSPHWDDELDQSLRKEQLLDYLQSILSKCTDGLYLADSFLNSRGWEQEGPLYDWMHSAEIRGELIDKA
ncbi:UvrD-helicase domain-containing protein [Natronospora cellulosivora (SeqCode)]